MSAIAESLSRVVVGNPIQFLNLILFPLLAEGPAQPGYRLLDEVLGEGGIRVTEVSDAGHVPELRVVNRGDWPVLLLDGEELIGAKQNRILNLSILAPAHQTIVIPVSCVEAGRWQVESAEFGSARRAHFAAGRARKAADVSDSLRRRGSRETDQGAVWRDIEERSRRMQVSSPTGAAAALYEGSRARLDDFRAAFTPQPSQCGALFAINGRLVGLDLFDSPATLAAALGKLVESYALDAIDAANDAQAQAQAQAPEVPVPWLKTIAAAPVERFAAVGEGEDWRLIGDGLAGGALVKDGRLIHLCAFRTAADADGGAASDPEGRERLALTLDTDRRLIRWRGGSERYLHLRIRAPRRVGERAPVDLALAIDRSGSMGGDKWPRACETALAAIDRLGPRDRIALVVFDDDIDTVLPLTHASTGARAAASAALGKIGPRGSTNLGEGWLTACGLIGHEPPNERLRRCFLLTDGQANVGIVDPSELAAHAAHLLAFGVRTSTFGVGDDYNEELLGALADAGGGTFQDIADAAGIPTAIARELGDALDVVYADSRVQLTWAADLTVAAMGPWPVTESDHGLTIRTGDLVSDQVLDLLVSLCFPAGNKNEDCSLRVTVSDGDHPLATELIHWTWVDSAMRKGQPRQAEVELRVGEQLAHQARRQAAARNRDGDRAGACDTLRISAQRIRKYGSENPALLALADSIESEIPRYERPLSSRDGKAQFARSRAETLGRNGAGARIRDRAHYLAYRPCQDNPDLAECCRKLSKIPREQAAALGQSALGAITTGTYPNAAGQLVHWGAAVTAAVVAKRSLPPDADLPKEEPLAFTVTQVQVVNESTLTAARRLTATARRVLTLNFGNGIHPGGGFQQGNRGQESLLCRSSALFATLSGDPMYAAHAARPLPDSTDWAILSPDVPVFRTDDGTPLDQPWPLSILTCAAPYAPKLGQGAATDRMQTRICRVLAIARAYGYTGLVLGAWGCGTYGNDPARIAAIFHEALKEQAGAFQEVVFAIADWSPERRFLAPFRILLATDVS
jgi:uncharacterized protein (TIGR02452 family)